MFVLRHDHWKTTNKTHTVTEEAYEIKQEAEDAMYFYFDDLYCDFFANVTKDNSAGIIVMYSGDKVTDVHHFTIQKVQ